jgi:hypothetical protein
MPGFMPGIHDFLQEKHQHCRHPEVLAVFGEPRRMAAYAPVAILRDAAQVRGSSG